MGKTRIFAVLAAAAAVAMAAAPTIAADPAAEKAVNARKSQMQLFSWNFGRLGAMAKEQAPYDAKAAKGAADNLAALAALDGAGLWPQGSDSGALGEATRAKPEIWTTFPAITEKSKALIDASAALAAVAGDGLDALKGGVGPVGQACGACHKEFREPAKQ